jgi:hypothetical protein
MSNRKLTTDYRAEALAVAIASDQMELFESYQKQINILLDPNLSPSQKVCSFIIEIRSERFVPLCDVKEDEVINMVWSDPSKKSLFGPMMLTCNCPVLAVKSGQQINGIPDCYTKIKPTPEGLWPFGLAQLQSRANLLWQFKTTPLN